MFAYITYLKARNYYPWNLLTINTFKFISSLKYDFEIYHKGGNHLGKFNVEGGGAYSEPRAVRA